MAESALYKSYRATEKAKAERALDEAFARLESAEPQPQPTPSPVAAEPVTAPASQQRKLGVFESIKRGFTAIPEQFYEGAKSTADAIYSREHGLTGPMVPRTESALQDFLGSRPAQFSLGVLNLVFPFSAFAREVGGDAGQWAANATGMLTDASLKQRLADAEASTSSGVDPMSGGELVGIVNAPNADVQVIRRLLTIPEEQRLEEFRQFSGTFSEVLTGTIPGYTSPAR